MNDKDPPPFGYTFSDDFFDNAAPHYDNNGPSLLSDMENQQLDNFFSSTNPFDLLDPQHIPPALDDKSTAHDYNNWEDFIAPPTVHRVTSTIPDQARLQTTFPQEPHHASSSSLHGSFLANTQDELQAAATLFNHAQPSYTNGRLHSFAEQPAAATNYPTNVAPSLNHAPLPMSVQPHGLMNQRMPSLLPNHSGHAIDPQFPPQWTSKAPQHTQTDFGPPLQKIDLKRSYTFGTDNSFNSPSGYSGANGRSAEHNAARHSINDVEEAHQHILRAVAGIDTVRTTSAAYQDSSSAVVGASRDDDDDDERSDDSASQEEHDDRPAKRRKKSIAQPGKETPRKAVRNGKARKTSLTDDSKKKRAATSTQKTHRENLTEEQKRNNHILSEQKRRDLIKQGYKDLNEVVPAVRGGGLSKSQILVEAATFLEKLIEDNIAYRKVAG
ncbi:hypothetical protein COCMIDRAFT_87051 [Bipolaris oryzae ATCC 44560]|uniref:BHLH domain-containing protein n=1 Tax=Bipolaris oryzae ATCC 44560 TaxID=930090 RepID=W6ZET6_COCMI|nr:uncharacterized protein COCMIDRAFT_87051 [Bipolaris oryzae ATCC 44560]EUC48525.1 hypothetical protein COCMIDRAFT_87051 [Bipolaris oryzae ATCC 44560]